MSEEFKPTPGPWSLPHFVQPDVDCQCQYVLSNAGMGAVCTVHCSGEGDWRQTGDHPKYEEAVANARLIAAAPETAAERDRLKEINAKMAELLTRLSSYDDVWSRVSTVVNAVNILGDFAIEATNIIAVFKAQGGQDVKD